MTIVIALLISSCDGVLRVGKTQGGGVVTVEQTKNNWATNRPEWIGVRGWDQRTEDWWIAVIVLVMVIGMMWWLNVQVTGGWSGRWNRRGMSWSFLTPSLNPLPVGFEICGFHSHHWLSDYLLSDTSVVTLIFEFIIAHLSWQLFSQEEQQYKMICQVQTCVRWEIVWKIWSRQYSSRSSEKSCKWGKRFERIAIQGEMKF